MLRYISSSNTAHVPFKVYSSNKYCQYLKRTKKRTKLPIRACIDGTLFSQSFNIAVSGTLSKAVSLCITYPFEACKVYEQVKRKWSNPFELYQGFHVFMITSIFQCFINYNIFFYMIKLFSLYQNKSTSIFYSSIVSCFITSFIKVHTTFIAKNIMFVKSKNVITTFQEVMRYMTWDLYSRSWLANLITDIPDSFVKFCVNSFLIVNCQFINNFQRSVITGYISSFVNTPLDYMLTMKMCKTVRINNTNNVNGNAIAVKDYFAGFKFRVMSSIIGNVVFFNIFNTLQPMGI